MTSVVTIVGGGFSGTMVLYNIIQKYNLKETLRIFIFDKEGKFAQGIAYGTKDPNHLLNVRALGMGALSGQPDHFVKWLEKDLEWKNNYSESAITPSSFCPRGLYCLYLKSLYQEAFDLAQSKNIEIIQQEDEVVGINLENSAMLEIVLKNKPSIKTDFLILATNFATSQKFKISENLNPELYIDNIWNAPENSFIKEKSLKNLNPNSVVGIIGTGLTMVDAAITLLTKDFRGNIIVISKHGDLPEAHLENVKAPLSPFSANLGNLKSLLRAVRQKIREVQSDGYDWHYVIDSLRSITTSYWSTLSKADQKRFMRHLFSFWNKVRHRMAPYGHKLLSKQQSEGKFLLKKGQVQAIERSNAGKINVITNRSTEEVDYLINCSGAQLNIKKTINPLLKNLYEQKFITSNHLNMGIDVAENFRVIGNKDLPIFAMGQLLTGQKLETVAVPELRDQSARIANEIVEMLILKNKSF